MKRIQAVVHPIDQPEATQKLDLLALDVFDAIERLHATLGDGWACVSCKELHPLRLPVRKAG